jgi:hypothetical protein
MIAVTPETEWASLSVRCGVQGRVALEAAGLPGAVASASTKAHLLQATRVHEDIFDRSIDVQVSRLRRKLEINPGAPRCACNVFPLP